VALSSAFSFARKSLTHRCCYTSNQTHDLLVAAAMHFLKQLVFTVFPCFPLNLLALHINDEECLRRSLPSSRCHSQVRTYCFLWSLHPTNFPISIQFNFRIEWRLVYCTTIAVIFFFFFLQIYITNVSLKLSYANACRWITVARLSYGTAIRELMIRLIWNRILVRFMFYDIHLLFVRRGCWCRYSTGFTSVHGETPSAEYARMRRESLESKFGHALGTYSSKSFNAIYGFGPFLALYRATIISFHVLRLMIWQLFVQDTKKRAVKVTYYLLSMLFIFFCR